MRTPCYVSGHLKKRFCVDLTGSRRFHIIVFTCVADSSRGPGYRPLKAETRVRIPYPLPDQAAPGKWFPGQFFCLGLIPKVDRMSGHDQGAPSLTSVNLFHKAHGRAQFKDFLARLGGRSNDLLPFETLASALQVHQQIPRPRPEEIPLDRIVGSVGRYKDFTRDFLPRNLEMVQRWARIDAALDTPEGLPPIELYKIGEVYFVADGNHRVSVARANGFSDIEAYVTEIPIDAGIEPGDTLDEAIIKAERVRFMAETGIAGCYPHLDIYFTRPGGFPQLLEHVQIHRRLMPREPGDGALVSLEIAACDWYENAYLPIVESIRERQLLRRFPGRTAGDLYVWIWGYLFQAYRLAGEKVTPEEGAQMLELRAESPFRQAVTTVMGRLAELSGVRSGADVPDWVTQTFEWDDGSLAELLEDG